MAGVDRIVRRANLKEKLENLENVVRSSKPIIAAQTMLQNVFRDGFTNGYKAREEEYQKELADKAAATVAENTDIFYAHPAEINTVLGSAPLEVNAPAFVDPFAKADNFVSDEAAASALNDEVVNDVEVIAAFPANMDSLTDKVQL